MDKYKINYIFRGEEDINAIFVKVLKKELKKNILMICKNKKYVIPSSSNYVSLKGDRNCSRI